MCVCPEKDSFNELVGIRIRVNNRVGEGNGQSSIRSK